MKLLSLNPNSGLEKQFLFWFAILFPVFIAFFLGIPVWIDYSLKFNVSAYTKFIEISALPIGVSSLSIPLGVLVSRLHGTKQTAVQIENSRIQIKNSEQDNRTKLYLSHFEHFCTHIDLIEKQLIDRYSSILPKETQSVIDKLAMYRLIYPENSLIDGVKPLGTHLNVFLRNAMRRLQRVYKEFLYSNPSNFLGNVSALEANFIDAQLRAFRCQRTRSSIFIKDERDVKSPNFIFGVSPKLEDYFYQVEFFFELSDAIESFEFNCPHERAGQMALMELRTPHSTMPHEKPELVAMWDKNFKNIFS